MREAGIGGERRRVSWNEVKVDQHIVEMVSFNTLNQRLDFLQTMQVW